ncbi:Syntaxin-18 [Orchesella cincta]|uniref:Syntaxin-18 n=1 Tax=Orchesella cincta TaxID=48709 RepID=A0A1D2MP72_ORCCI|nr:Syntaxin-18 [Orchesella cincta]
MDITSIFKECVAQNQKTFKELDSILSASSEGKADKRIPPKSTVFPGKKSEHYAKSREISQNITKLRDFLKECRTAYVNVGASKHASANSSVFNPSFSSTPSSTDIPIMSDKERDQIDNDVQLIIQNCQKAIHDFQIRMETSDSVRNQTQLQTHLENVINSLANYLKCVTEIYSEMRAIRVKRTVDYQTMSRLASHPASSRGFKNKNSISSMKSNNKGGLPNLDTKRKFSASSASYQSPLSPTISEVDGFSMSGGSNVTSDAETTVPTYFEEDDAMSPEELQMLEQENAALLNELNTLNQEVEQIESNVVQIAQLQEIFTEKVLQQERDIDRIGDSIVHASENIRDGNEQVRQAIQSSADFRAYVLFFIIVMSFSLLFLDWYND